MSDILQSPPVSASPATLSDRAREYAVESVAPNTRRAYAAQLRLWMEHAEAHGLAQFPAEQVHVASWLAARADAGQTVSTLRTAVAAVRAGHHAKGLAFDTAHPALANVLKGIARSKPRAQRQVEPLRAAAVLDMIRNADGRAIALRDAALLAVGYVFGLRRSELVGLDYYGPGGGGGFVRLTPNAIELTLLRSKTAIGEPDVVVVPREQNEVAAQVIKRWVALADIRPGTLLLRRVSKGGLIDVDGLTDQSVALIIRKHVVRLRRRQGRTAAEAQADAAAFAGHSLRVGFAVSAAEAGADLRSIASVTRHRSLAMPQRYARKADQFRTSPHRFAGVGLADPKGAILMRS